MKKEAASRYLYAAIAFAVAAGVFFLSASIVIFVVSIPAVPAEEMTDAWRERTLALFYAREFFAFAASLVAGALAAWFVLRRVPRRS